MDGRSHTGIAIFLGGTLVYAASRKQKCVTKSPADSELVALTDNIAFTELFAEFLGFITNTFENKPLIFEDCTAVISLVTLGGGVARTKHLRVRIAICKEALDEKRISIHYVPTTHMKADGLSKPLEGQAFINFTNDMLGKEESKKD
jgi:hypothetical protein